VKVIEDNAQAFGAAYGWRKTGTLGDIACLSFFPSKNLGAYGDGGMVVTNDGDLAERVRMLRTHGWRKKYCPEATGYNSRLDELQAAILRIKLQYVDRWNERRRDLARQYTEQLASLDIDMPREAPQARHVYHLYVIRVKNRDRVQEYLKQEGIASAVYYPQPLHLLEPCRPLGHREGSFPIAEQASQETLALPLYPEMSGIHVGEVIRAIEQCVRPQSTMVV
jgi:dTDP-4-amino-4,6-dideoxygalactose transaminase